MSTFRNALKIARTSVGKQKNFPLSCHPNFNTDKTSFIFHHHHGNKAPLTTSELPTLFLESLAELMTSTWDANVASPPLLHTRMITLSTPMDPLVEGQETEEQLQLPLEDPLSSLKWSLPSKQEEEHLPAPMRRKQLQWNLHYPGLPPTSTILQPP